jgi:hypothetical protein
MSDNQTPVELTENTSQPATEAEAGNVTPPEAGPTKPTNPMPIPDWRPLGTIQDYFAEQIRQDGFR